MRVAGTLQTKELPDKPLEITLTVMRALGGPSLSVRVTGPLAPDQVMLKGSPAVTELKDGLVNSTACARAKVAAATKIVENCMIDD